MSRSVIAGGIIWTCLAVAVLLRLARLTTIELLFLLAPLVIVPLGLQLCARLAPEIGMELPSRSVQRLQLPAALCAAAAFFLPQGIAAAFLVLPWLGFGCFMGLTGLLNLILGKFRNLRVGCVIISFLYLPVGCAWLVASRVGLSPMGFQEPIVLLTAVHFHFAGFAAPLLACATGNAVRTKSVALRSILNIVTAGVMAGPGLLAAGFVIGAASQTGGGANRCFQRSGPFFIFLVMRSGRAASVRASVTHAVGGVRVAGDDPRVHLGDRRISISTLRPSG